MLALALPFAASKPVLTTPWLSVTDDKLLIALAVLGWLTLGLPTRGELKVIMPALALLGVATVSSMHSDFPDDALKATGHLAMTLFGILLALRVNREGVIWALLVGAACSALLGIGEALALPPVDAFLGLFKVAPTRVGGELRVSATFQYATIAAMYFEMIVPLAIALAAAARSRLARAAATGVALVCTGTVVLSLTRAGAVTLVVIVIGFLLAARLPTYRRSLQPALLVGALLVAMLAIDFVRDPIFDLRLTTENDADWYGAVYQAPANVQLHGSQPTTVGVDVRNAGKIVWSPTGVHPFVLSYRWLTQDGQGVLQLPRGTVPLPRDIPPGATMHLEAPIDASALPNGSYLVEWNMIQQDVVQFDERGWPTAETTVTLDQSSAVAAPAVLPRDDAQAPWVVPRTNLWQAAVQLISRNPVLGVGTDNFRHLYGAQLGLDSWDERVQANNLYLEVLSDWGLLGLLAFAWLVAPAGWRLARRIRARAAPRDLTISLGIGLALLAFLVHGAFDTFLTFTPTALLFALCLGLAQAVQKPHVSGR